MYPPTVLITDMPHMIANHGNRRTPNLFNPNNGTTLPVTKENINGAKEKRLEHVKFDFIDESKYSSISKVNQ